MKAHPRCLPEAALDLPNRPNLASEPEFAYKNSISRNRAVEHAGNERHRNGSIARSFDEAKPAHDVEENVELPKGNPGALFEHGKEECKPLGVKAGADPLGCAVGSFRGKRLYFHKKRPSPLHGGDYCIAGGGRSSFAEEEL